MYLHYDGKNRPVFLAIHLLQHLPEWARCLILPFPPPLVRGLHSKMRWLAQLCQAGGLVVQFTHQVGELPLNFVTPPSFSVTPPQLHPG